MAYMKLQNSFLLCLAGLVSGFSIALIEHTYFLIHGKDTSSFYPSFSPYFYFAGLVYAIVIYTFLLINHTHFFSLMKCVTWVLCSCVGFIFSFFIVLIFAVWLPNFQSLPLLVSISSFLGSILMLMGFRELFQLSKTGFIILALFGGILGYISFIIAPSDFYASGFGWFTPTYTIIILCWQIFMGAALGFAIDWTIDRRIRSYEKIR